MCECNKYAPVTEINGRTYTWQMHGGPAASNILPLDIILKDIIDDYKSLRINIREYYDALTLCGELARATAEILKDREENRFQP